MKRFAVGFLAALAFAGSFVVAQDWGTLATISSTLGVNANRVCVGEGFRISDIGCPTYAPTVGTDGLLTATNVSVTGAVSVTGNVSANKFIGDGSELTGVTAASGDRIVSGTTSMIAISNTGYISVTTGGVTTGYFTPAGVLVANGISVSTNRMSATTGYFSGNVGIGTANPVGRIHVLGAESGSPSNGTLLLGSNDFTSGMGDWVGLNYTTLANNDVNLHLGRKYSSDGSFQNLVTVKGDGNVGIGTTSPTYNLDVVEGGTGSSVLRLRSGTAGGAAAAIRFMEDAGGGDLHGWSIRNEGSSNRFEILRHSSSQTGVEALAIERNTGYVGIGTTSPQATLQVSGNLVVSTSTQTTTPTLHVGSDGKVGIGTNNPGQALDVFGSVRFGGAGGNSVEDDGRTIALLRDGGLRLGNSKRVAFSSSAQWYGTPDTFLAREEAGVIRISGTTAYGGLSVGHISATTVSTTDAIQVGSSSLDCSVGIPGALRYNSGALEVCDGSDWGSVGGGALGDRIVSGSLAVIANSATSIISLSTAGTDWGYLRAAGNSFLPRLGTNYVSSTLISTTYVQLSSATDVLACNTNFAGAIRYISGTMQVCDGNEWGSVGGSIPGGTIAAFEASVCPSGWTEYTPARGRFLRGLDNGAGNDPDWPRAAGSTQGDELASHLHSVNPPSTNTSSDGAHSHTMPFNSYAPRNLSWAVTPGGGGAGYTVNGAPAVSTAGNHNHSVDIPAFNSANAGGGETRPKNVAVIFCRYAGFNPTLETGVATLASLSDVSVGGATVGQVLTFDGGSWVPSDTAATVSAMDDLSDVDTSGVAAGSYLRYNGTTWVVSTTYDVSVPDGDRITSGTLAVVANSETSYVSLSTDGTVWGYLSSAMSYLPQLVASRISATHVSSTYLQVTSASTVLSCDSGLTGTLRYTSGTIQVCDGTDWANVTGSALLPAGGIVAFNASSCPAGWNQVTALAGRTIIGVGTLVSDTYALGAIGGSSKVALSTANLPSHSHTVNPPSTASNSAGAHTHTVDPPSTNTNTTGNHNHSTPTKDGSNNVGHTGNYDRPSNSNGSTGNAGNHSHSVNIPAFNSGSAGAHTHNVDIAEFNSGSVGSGTAHENRMPYKAYIYCESTGEEGEGGEGGGGGGGATTLAGLEDVDLTDVDDGDMLIYNSGVWVVGIPTANPADGDKGDITVADGGTTWTIDAGAVGTAKLADEAVTFAKIQNLTGGVLLGRSASDTGVVEEIAIGEGLRLEEGILSISGTLGEGGGDGGSGTEVAFSVNKGGTDQTGVPLSTDTLVTWSNEEFDTNDNFDTATGRFTPTVAGKYILTASVRYGGFSSGKIATVKIRKNGTAVHEGSAVYSGAGGAHQSVASAVVDADGENDYFDVATYQNESASETIQGSAHYTYFTGALLSGGGGGGGEGGEGGGEGASSLAELTDVSADAPFDGAVLRYNESISKWETVDVSTAMSTTTMVSGWPDALMCSGGGTSRILYLDSTGGSWFTYMVPRSGAGGGTLYDIVFNADGTQSAQANLDGFDCVSGSWTVSDFYANGRAFNFIGGEGSGGGASEALGDRITSGTLAVIANSETSYVSLSTAGTTWGYLSSGASYLPTISAGKVSPTTISTTYMQLSSASTVLACNTAATGTMRYTSGTMQVCDGSEWGNIGIGVPTGTIAAFAASSCPSGWSEYTPARGRFLRGIDNGAGNDPDGTRAAGNVQADLLKSHTHTVNAANYAAYTANDYAAGGINSPHGSLTSNASGGAETRPKNVAVTFCQYAGFDSELSAGVATLASLSDVSVGGAAAGQSLVFDGASWVPSTTTGGGAGAIDDLSDAYTDAANLILGHAASGLGGNDLANVAVGLYALDALNNSGASNNVAVGYGALSQNQSGDHNISIGQNSLGDNTAASYNVAIGGQALSDATGAGNIAIGYAAGDVVVAGTSNTLVGHRAGDNVSSGSSNIVIGADVDAVSATASNQLNIGNTLYGDLANDRIGIGVAAPSVALEVGGTVSATGLYIDGDIQYTGVSSDVSDRRLKTDITSLKARSLEELLRLQPVSFRMKAGGDTELGFIAQDVEQVFPELVHTADDAAGTKSLNYTGLIAPIVKAIQELRDWVLSLVDELRGANDRQDEELRQLRQEMEELKAAGTSELVSATAALRAENVELRRELRAANDNIKALRMRIDAANDNAVSGKRAAGQ